MINEKNFLAAMWLEELRRLLERMDPKALEYVEKAAADHGLTLHEFLEAAVDITKAIATVQGTKALAAVIGKENFLYLLRRMQRASDTTTDGDDNG